MFKKKQLLLVKIISQYTLNLQVIVLFFVFISWESNKNWQYSVALKKWWCMNYIAKNELFRILIARYCKCKDLQDMNKGNLIV